MILEATRMWAEELKDPSTGVNALLDLLTRDGADTQPPPVNIYTWCDDEWVHAWEIPKGAVTKDRGALILRIASDVIPLAVPGNPELRAQQPEFGIVALYARLKDAAEENMRVYPRDASYTMRCVQRCTHVWMEDTRANSPKRTRNHVNLSMVRGFSQAIYTPDTPGYIGQAVMLDVRMVDRWATNIEP